jgi:hypothetical protein
MRKPIVYPGNHGQPCLCEYDIAFAPTTDSPSSQQVWVMFFELPPEQNRGRTFANLPTHSPSFLMTKVAEQELCGIRLDLIRFFYYHRPNQHFYLLEFGFKPDYDSYERRGGAFHKRGSRLLGTEAHEYHSSQVIAGLADVTWTEQRPVTDEQFEHLKAAFGLQFIKVD